MWLQHLNLHTHTDAPRQSDIRGQSSNITAHKGETTLLEQNRAPVLRQAEHGMSRELP